MRDLQNKLSLAQNYAKSHSDREQARYAAHYNLRTKTNILLLANKCFCCSQIPRQVKFIADGRVQSQ